MNIRDARLDDSEALAQLHAESWRSAYRGAYSDAYLDGDVVQDRKSVWHARLSAPRAGQFTIVAEQGAAIVGFACAFGADDPRWGTLLDNLHVRPDRKWSGIGTQLIREVALRSQRDWPETGLYLWVLEVNAPARRFYERLGAQNAERSVSEPPGGGSVVGLRYVWPSLTLLVDATMAKP